jgi:hypothetical protein
MNAHIPDLAHPGFEIRSALDLLGARAQFDAPERTVHIRVGEHAGRVYLDHAHQRWLAVEVGAGPNGDTH